MVLTVCVTSVQRLDDVNPWIERHRTPARLGMFFAEYATTLRFELGAILLDVLREHCAHALTR